MTDVHTAQVRSYNMSKIKSKNTKPELLVRKHLFSLGFRYRLHDKRLPGKPDLVFPKYKKVIFVNGCYWHGHDRCKYFVKPKTRTEWWMKKINGNKERDRINLEKLEKLNWDPIIIWECELKSDRKEKTFELLVQNLKGN